MHKISGQINYRKKAKPTYPLLVAKVLVVVLLGGAVHLGDGDAGLALELGAQLVPGGRETLAVAAPRRVELNEGHSWNFVGKRISITFTQPSEDDY